MIKKKGNKLTFTASSVFVTFSFRIAFSDDVAVDLGTGRGLMKPASFCVFLCSGKTVEVVLFEMFPSADLAVALLIRGLPSPAFASNVSAFSFLEAYLVPAKRLVC